MATDDTRVVLAGGGQVLQRDVALEEALDPVGLMAQAARRAAEDCGAGPRVWAALDAIGVVDVPAWRPKNAPRLLAETLGAHPATEVITALGGESPLLLLNHFAAEIAAGRVHAALVTGANAVRTLARTRRAGRPVAWPSGGDGEPVRLGADKAGSSEREQRYGLTAPPFVYPLFENALRARRGLDLETHRARMGALMHRFTCVAARNPYAWFPVERSSEELTRPAPGNRMIAFPYPKYLNAVLETDQAAAVLLLSARAARALGVPEAHCVHWWGGGSAVEEAWFPTERPDFAACTAMGSAVDGALAQGGSSLDEIAAFDFYSCFPVAVEMACEMLGLDEDDPRGLTVTGGLPYFGGPGNNHSLHAVVSMAERLRARPGARGLVTGNGWYLTKHSACVLAAAPRESGAPVRDPGSRPAGKAVETVAEANGRARVETYTVTYSREGAPERGIVVARLESGARFLANTPAGDLAILEDLLSREGVGRTGRVAHTDGTNVFRPD